MKFLTVFVVSIAITAAIAHPVTEDEKQLEKAADAAKLDMKEVEKLLQQIEAQEHKPKPDDGTVSESLNKLFTTFRQMTSAYVNVLNAVNKSLGLPKYPTIPGLNREARQTVVERGRFENVTVPLRQLQENLSQLQSSASEMGSLVRRVVSNMAEDTRVSVLNQFKKFTDLWTAQLNEISNMLQAEASGSKKQARQDGISQPTVFDQINRYVVQVTNSIRDFANNIYAGIRNRVLPTGAPQLAAGATF